MRTLARIYLFLALLGAGDLQADGVYQYKKASRDGIGKFYFGREIANVMGFSGAAWLDRSSREQEEKLSLLIKNLGIKKGMIIADVGAGSGRLTMPMAKLTGPKGKVYAVDIQQEMLTLIKGKAKKLRLKNVIPVKATEKKTQLPKGKVDLAILVDVYHELSWPMEVMLNLSRSMAKGGLVVLVEYRGEDKKLRIKPLHKMTQVQVRKEMSSRDFGLKYLKTVNVLPRQHMIFFKKI